MKRKLPLLIAIFSLIIPLTGCKKNEEKITILNKTNMDSFVYLNKDNLNDKFRLKESFLLVLGEMGCSTCELIKPKLIEFIKKYEYVIYFTEITNYQSIVQDYNLANTYTSSTILLIDEGKIIKDFPYDSNLYYSEGKLDLTLSSYVRKSNVYTINDYEEMKYGDEIIMYEPNLKTTNELDSLISSNKKVMVLYSWKECKDCQDFSTSFLEDYMKNSSSKLYIYEVDYLRNKKDSEGMPDLGDFKEFATKYEFSSYREGKVPSIVLYENSKKIDMAVYLNDVIENIDNKYIVTNSYYNDLINLEDIDELNLKARLKEIELSKIKDFIDNNK